MTVDEYARSMLDIEKFFRSTQALHRGSIIYNIFSMVLLTPRETSTKLSFLTSPENKRKKGISSSLKSDNIQTYKYLYF